MEYSISLTMPQRNVTSGNRPLRLARLQWKNTYKNPMNLEIRITVGWRSQKVIPFNSFRMFPIRYCWLVYTYSTVFDISHETPRFGLFRLPLLYLTPPAEGFPSADLREILHGPPQMPNVQNRVKILPKSLTAWVGCTNVTDRQCETLNTSFCSVLNTVNNAINCITQ